MKAYAVPFEKFVNLADARLGTKIVSVTDDWFADANRMFQPTPAVWKEGVFDDNGKWMDGWESRRKRFEGHDSAVIRLGVPGTIKGLDIDTSFFTGNFPPSASLEGCFLAEGDPTEKTQWVEVLSAVELQGTATTTTKSTTIRHSATCASTSSRTAALHVCVCTVCPSATGRALATTNRLTWLRPSTVAVHWLAPTNTSAA